MRIFHLHASRGRVVHSAVVQGRALWTVFAGQTYERVGSPRGARFVVSIPVEMGVAPCRVSVMFRMCAGAGFLKDKTMPVFTSGLGSNGTGAAKP